ncbi:MAG: hypothetical protein WEF86_05530 [Gemmatimonadota bacterium]
MHFAILLQEAGASEPVRTGWFQYVLDFLDSPAPYSPFSEYLLLLFIMWLIERRHTRKRSFEAQAQEVLDQKYADGEISKSAYNKFRQDAMMRPKR